MSTTDVTLHSGGASLSEQMQFAQAVTSGSRAASLLPESYRENPANVLIAVGLGSSMGLSPAESLYRIAVIKGRPTAGAELIAANVRKAGHRLRVRGDDTTCTATIIRADDQDYEFTVTRDLAWAQRMGLATNDNYKKQPGTMLQWRAITAVARLACPEALYGVTYTADEVMESERPAARPVAAGPVTAAEILGDDAPEPEQPALDVPDLEPDPEPLTDRTRKQMFALLAEHGITDEDQQRTGMSRILGREIQSRSELSEQDAALVVAALKARA